MTPGRSPQQAGIDSAANACHASFLILLEGGEDWAGEATATCLTEVAGASQHRALLN